MFGKKKMKVPFMVVLSFSRKSLAEIARNTVNDEQILAKVLKREASKFNVTDFKYFNFVNDDNKVYRVIFQVLMKDKEKLIKRLFTELKYAFDCSDIEIVYKQDFDFGKYHLKNGLARGEINTYSKPNNSYLDDIPTSKISPLSEIDKKVNPPVNDLNYTVASASNHEFISNTLETILNQNQNQNGFVNNNKKVENLANNNLNQNNWQNNQNQNFNKLEKEDLSQFVPNHTNYGFNNQQPSNNNQQNVINNNNAVNTLKNENFNPNNLGNNNQFNPDFSNHNQNISGGNNSSNFASDFQNNKFSNQSEVFENKENISEKN
ncbi:MAG: hypothetical protein K2O21_00325 [Malacoplasma sp.]|nr:hypothetical protein [Malacoplasma sp.]